MNEWTGLYFYEQLCHFVLEDPEGKSWRDKRYFESQPVNMTAVKRRRELRRIDANYDGHLSFIEYLLDQYKHVVTKEEFCSRYVQFKNLEGRNEVQQAMERLDRLNKQKGAMDLEQQRLELLLKRAKKSNSIISQRVAERELDRVLNDPLQLRIKAAIINAEAALRQVRNLYKYNDNLKPHGTLYWQDRKIQETKR